MSNRFDNIGLGGLVHQPASLHWPRQRLQRPSCPPVELLAWLHVPPAWLLWWKQASSVSQHHIVYKAAAAVASRHLLLLQCLPLSAALLHLQYQDIHNVLSINTTMAAITPHSPACHTVYLLPWPQQQPPKHSLGPALTLHTLPPCAPLPLHTVPLPSTHFGAQTLERSHESH